MFKGQFLIFFQDRKFTWGYLCFANAVNKRPAGFIILRMQWHQEKFPFICEINFHNRWKMKGCSNNSWFNT